MFFMVWWRFLTRHFPQCRVRTEEGDKLQATHCSDRNGNDVTHSGGENHDVPRLHKAWIIMRNQLDQLFDVHYWFLQETAYMLTLWLNKHQEKAYAQRQFGGFRWIMLCRLIFVMAFICVRHRVDLILLLLGRRTTINSSHSSRVFCLFFFFTRKS